MRCSKCGFGKVIKAGYKKGVRQWQCGSCGHLQDDYPHTKPLKLPRTLYLDIEMSFGRYYNFGRKVYGEYLPIDQMDKQPYIICWSASWMDSKEIISQSVTSAQARKWDDKTILSPLWRLIDDADIIAGHNVASYDIPKIYSRFLHHSFTSPSEHKIKDTLKMAKKKFRFESNSLDFILNELGLRPKQAMSKEDWIKIAESGDQKTLDKMLKYNRWDVAQGKKALQGLEGWMHYKPDFGMTKK